MEAMLSRGAEAVWGWPMMLLFVAVGLVYTLRLRGLQLRSLPKAFGCFRREQGASGLSPYGALCTALAATIGTGNIVGVATAVCAGGPGALFWMLLAALLGMATQYAEGFLAAKYRYIDGFGGPFCYIERGLGSWGKWLAVSYALMGAAVGLLGVGTVTQVSSITSAVDGFFHSSQSIIVAGRELSYTVCITVFLLCTAAAAVLLGGAKRITAVCQALVPLMAGLYLLCALLLLLRHAQRIPEAISLILRSAFRPRAVLGAGAGITVKAAMRMGIGRGVFTNEAGLGTTAIAAAASNQKDPIRQGLASMTGTFIDTVIICSLTGLCLVVTGVWNSPAPGEKLTELAWCRGLPWPERLSSFLLLLCLVFFAFATVIGWSFYAEACLKYLVGERKWALRLYRFAYLCVMAAAPLLTAKAAWSLADILNALMAAPNLIALLLLQKEVVTDTRAGLAGKKKNNRGIM